MFLCGFETSRSTEEGIVSGFEGNSSQVTFSLLTDFPSSDHCTLFRIECLFAGRRLEKLDKPVCLLDGYLRQLAVFVENVKQIPFGDSFSGKIT